jgi:hypothetical protein
MNDNNKQVDQVNSLLPQDKLKMSIYIKVWLFYKFILK